MDTLQGRISPKRAIDEAFKTFRDFFSGVRTMHILLEGLEYLEVGDEWRVTIGFDSGRSKETGGPFVSAGLGQKTSEPIREFRSIYLNAKDGAFLRMDPA